MNRPEANLQTLDLVDELVHRQAGIDDYRFLGRRVSHDVGVDLAVELDFDDAELHVNRNLRQAERSPLTRGRTRSGGGLRERLAAGLPVLDLRIHQAPSA